MRRTRRRQLTLLLHCLSAFFLISLTTWLLSLMQVWLMRSSAEPIRAFEIGFLLPIGWITYMSGRRVALLSLFLSALYSAYVLMPTNGFHVQRPSDVISLSLLFVTGILVIFAISTAKYNKELHRNAQSRAEREHVLNQIATASRRTVAPEAIRAQVAAILAKALDADRCYFTDYDYAQETAWVREEWHRDRYPSLAGKRALSDCRDALRAHEQSGTALVVPDVETEVHWTDVAKFLEFSHLRSAIQVPFFNNQQVVAILTLAMDEEPRAWSRDEVAFVEVAAAEARAAVEEARIRLREQTIAVTLQRALLPMPQQNLPGLSISSYYKASLNEASIGGDFCDVYSLDADSWAIVVGDVSGKGLQAAAQIATVRNMLRCILYQQRPLAHSIAELNEILVDHNLLTGFVTLFTAIYHVRSSSLTYVSCGHEPALLLRSSGTQEQLAATGPLLGVFDEAEYEQKTVRLHPADAFLIYTDGASEAGPDRMHQLSDQGLARLLQAQQNPADADTLIAQIVAGIKSYAQDKLHDDICLLGGIVQSLPSDDLPADNRSRRPKERLLYKNITPALRPGKSPMLRTRRRFSP